MKAWLKGGLIGLGVGIIILLSFILGSIYCINSGLFGSAREGFCQNRISLILYYYPFIISTLLLSWVIIPVAFLYKTLKFEVSWSFILPFIIPFGYFILGAIIGLIAGKIKNKQNQVKNGKK